MDNLLNNTVFVIEEKDLERLRDLLNYIRELMAILEKALEED